jgi:hypothetical protein
LRRYVIPALAGLALAGVAACSPDAGDFKDDAEGFIEDDDGEVESQLGLALSDAACDDPSSSDVGSTFACTAVAEDGTTYNFTVEITGDNSYEVGGGTPSTGSTPPAGSTPSTGSVPPGTGTVPPGTGGTGGTGGTVPATTTG